MRYTEDFTTLLPKQFELELWIGTGEMVDISRGATPCSFHIITIHCLY